MKKPGTPWVMKTLTDVHDKTQPNGALHSYDYFENEDGTWIYNICFHHVDGPNVGFPTIQLTEAVPIPIEDAISKARERFYVTKFIPQPAWNN